MFVVLLIDVKTNKIVYSTYNASGFAALDRMLEDALEILPDNSVVRIVSPCTVVAQTIQDDDEYIITVAHSNP